MKRLSFWKKWVVLTATGGALFQTTTSCNDLATGVITVSSVVTAGGVVYIVSQILQD
jgi:hypothetical protein